jgi:uncharacterized protein
MNTPGAFEWNEEKARANLAKHGIPFEAALDVFLDERRIDAADERVDYGEDRRNVIGAVDGIVLHVTYTMRGEVARLISARRAGRKERKRYGERA